MKQERIICDICGQDIDTSIGSMQSWYECELRGSGYQVLGREPERPKDIHYECLKVMMSKERLERCKNQK